MTETREQAVARILTMAKNMRINSLEMALGAGSNGAHLGPAFSCIEILATLYGTVMQYRVNEPNWVDRDRFLASKAHCVLAHYTALHAVGFLSKTDLDGFEKNEGTLVGHPVMNTARGFEYSGGSLGMALPFGIGMAMDMKQKKRSGRVFVLLGDGECDEGSNWEAFLAAPHFKLHNLVAIVDQNKLQYDGTTTEIMNLGDMQQKLTAFGWQTVSVNGHDVNALLTAFETPHPHAPLMILADTIKGKGVSFMENKREWHHSRLSQPQYDIAIAEVAGEVR